MYHFNTDGNEGPAELSGRPNVLRQLRALVPERRLHYFEAQRITELQANRFRELQGLTGPELLEETISSLPRLNVRRAPGLPVSGFAQWHNGTWIVALNGLEPDTRQRFSLAHELFHIINHHNKDRLHPDTKRFTGYDTGERLADYFAACLLMPKRYVKSLAGQGLTLTELAATFDVSTTAMDIRLQQLRIAGQRPPRHPRPGGQLFDTTYYRQSADCSSCLEGTGA